MTKKPLTPFGLAAKKALLDLNQPQSWLIQEVRKDTGKYVDHGYLSKIYTGERAPLEIMCSISKILHLEDRIK